MGNVLRALSKLNILSDNNWFFFLLTGIWWAIPFSNWHTDTTQRHSLRLLRDWLFLKVIRKRLQTPLPANEKMLYMLKEFRSGGHSRNVCSEIVRADHFYFSLSLSFPGAIHAYFSIFLYICHLCYTRLFLYPLLSVLSATHAFFPPYFKSLVL